MFVRSNGSRSILAVIIALMAMGGPLIGMTVVSVTAPNYIQSVEDIGIPILSLLLIIAGGSVTGIALLPSFFLGAVCGYLLSGGWSYFTSACGLAWATAIGLYVGRFFNTNFLEVLLKQKKNWWATYRRIVNTSGLFLPTSLALLRLSPHMPFALTNLVCSRLPIPAVKIWLFSFLGLLPRTFLAVYVGGKLKDWRSLLNLERPPWELAFSAILFAILFYFIRRMLRRFETT